MDERWAPRKTACLAGSTPPPVTGPGSKGAGLKLQESQLQVCIPKSQILLHIAHRPTGFSIVLEPLLIGAGRYKMDQQAPSRPHPYQLKKWHLSNSGLCENEGGQELHQRAWWHCLLGQFSSV